MPSSTKKLGPAGRYGARYGSLARKQVTTVERVQRRKHLCQSCGAHAVRREGTGIWKCRKCDHTFAGGAYLPRTGAGLGTAKALRGISEKLIRGRAEEEPTSFQEAMEAYQDEEDLEALEQEVEAFAESEPLEPEAADDEAEPRPDEPAASDGADDSEATDEAGSADEPEERD